MSGAMRWLREADPQVSVLREPDGEWTARALREAVTATAHALRERGVRVLATALDNGAPWAILDLAAWQAGCVHVPVPAFFTAAQVAHVLERAGVDAVVQGGDPRDGELALPIPGIRLARRSTSPVELPPGTVKISFTSGSTGRPRGVCLGGEALVRVAEGVAEALAPLSVRRHLSALPLPVLLENTAGLYAALAAGAEVVLAPLARVGLRGSSCFDPAALQDAVTRESPDSVIVLPQMLRAWTAHRARGERSAASAAPRLVAVGGAAVGTATLAAARAVGLPAYEGYGLTEGASVQTLNLPGADRPGSAGRALPHARVRVSVDGEIEVAGTPMLAYLDTPRTPPPAWWPTGDLGRIDADGFLHLAGRRTNLLITAFGRNVSPEWVETELQSQPAIAHAVVCGDGLPTLVAVVWPSRPDLAPQAVADAIASVNATLPDYARIGRWVRASVGFDAASGTATANGRPVREAIESVHRAALAAAYRGTAVDELP